MDANSTAEKPRRVVITGMGILSPAGNNLEDFWQGLVSGRSFVREVQAFDTSNMPIHSAGEVDNEPLLKSFSPTALKRTDRAVVLGLVAADQALTDAGVLEHAQDGLPIGAVIGSGIGPCHYAEEAYLAYADRGWHATRPTTIPRMMFNCIASQISIKYHLTGFHYVVAAACSSSSLAMVEAYDAVRSGRENVILTGGCDSPLVPSIYGAWINLRILAKHPVPEKASRPFDKDRDGLVLAEGGAMLVFEELEHAKARNAKIYGEILGYGTSSDATHITNPSAEGQAKSLQRALESARLSPGDIGYINAHGTSTVLNDLTETRAIKLAFADRAGEIPISSTKSIVGHTMGASGAVELIATILTVRHQIAPPTVNLETPDPECDLDYVPNAARPAAINVALTNSFAFGGANSVIAVSGYEGNQDG